jgi:hypothetical protein
VLNPYWGSEEDSDSGGVIAHFQSGWQRDDYTILITGGSVAALFAGTQAEALRAAIAHDPGLAGRRIVILNGAHAAYKQPQLLNRVALLLALGCRIDAVVAIDGFNEVTGPLDNHREGRHPAWPGAPTWSAALPDAMASSRERIAALDELYAIRDSAAWIVDTSLNLGLHRSAVLGHVAVHRLNALGSRRFKLQAVVSQVDPRNTERELREEAGPPFRGDQTAAWRSACASGASARWRCTSCARRAESRTCTCSSRRCATTARSR